MRANKWCRGLTAFLAASMLAGMYPSSAAASSPALDKAEMVCSDLNPVRISRHRSQICS